MDEVASKKDEHENHLSYLASVLSREDFFSKMAEEGLKGQVIDWSNQTLIDFVVAIYCCNEGMKCVLASDDLPCSSVSIVANYICGQECNGWKSRKNKEGNPIDVYRQKQRKKKAEITNRYAKTGDKSLHIRVMPPVFLRLERENCGMTGETRATKHRHENRFAKT